MDLGVVQAPIKEYGALKSDIEARKDQLAAIEKKLFWQKDISKFLNELTRLASDLDIEFVSLKPEQLSIVGQEGGEADLLVRVGAATQVDRRLSLQPAVE